MVKNKASYALKYALEIVDYALNYANGIELNQVFHPKTAVQSSHDSICKLDSGNLLYSICTLSF